MLVKDIFQNAMEIIGAITLDEVPEDSEMQKCIRHGNLMLDSWSARRLLQLSTTQENFTLTGGKVSYTIGSGGNFNTSKPINIVNAFIRDSTNNDYRLDVITLDLYESYQDKLISTGIPQTLYYDPGVTQQTVQTGTIYLYPIPDGVQTYKLYIDSEKYFTEFVNLTDNVTFTPAYYRAIVYSLAVALWRPMGRKGPIPPDIIYLARESMQIIETMNARQVISKIDVTGGGAGSYDIYSDRY